MSTNYFPLFYCVKKQADLRNALSVNGEACPEELAAGSPRAPCACATGLYGGKCLYDLSFEETVEVFLDKVVKRRPQSNEEVSSSYDEVDHQVDCALLSELQEIVALDEFDSEIAAEEGGVFLDDEEAFTDLPEKRDWMRFAKE